MYVSLAMVFTSCGKDDGEESLLAPAHAVGSLTFTDTDLDVQKIGGTLSWQLPAQETHIDGYVIYLGSSSTAKGDRLGEVSKGVSSFTVPQGTALNAYLLVAAYNAAGESTNITSIQVTDRTSADKEEPAPPRTVGVFVLNRGNYQENNASLSYYNLLEKVMIPDVYKSVNQGQRLGDSAEQILIYGSRIYVTVTSSNSITILDHTGGLIKKINPQGPLDEPLSPRRMAAEGGKVYVSYFAGHSVAVLDTTLLDIEKTVPVGRNPEQLAIAGGKLYVANSGGLSFPDYGHTLSVINLASFTVEKEIEVTINPVRLVTSSRGDIIYLISMGNYGDIGNTLQRINTATDEVTKMGGGSIFTMAGDKLYVVYAQWGAPEITYTKYDALTGSVETDGFITDGTVISSPSAIGVDPLDGKIYITDSAYGSTSTLYMFSADGKLETKIETEGYDSSDIVFFVQ
jgi:DNA-binding beta-propeller fold protein YncE